jgi:hypothetical protein
VREQPLHRELPYAFQVAAGRAPVVDIKPHQLLGDVGNHLRNRLPSARLSSRSASAILGLVVIVRSP